MAEISTRSSPKEGETRGTEKGESEAPPKRKGGDLSRFICLQCAEGRNKAWRKGKGGDPSSTELTRAYNQRSKKNHPFSAKEKERNLNVFHLRTRAGRVGEKKTVKEGGGVRIVQPAKKRKKNHRRTSLAK